MSHVPLSKAPPYNALSYHWGETTNTTAIEVNAIQVQVSVNLEAALRRLGAAGIYTIWADALCINQRDKKEKSHQVPRIGAIFRKASEVAIWLGDELDMDETSREYLSTGTIPEIDRDTCLSTLPIFNHLLGRPYWRRVWIIQELAVASRISLFCERYRIPWQSIDASCRCCQTESFTNSPGRSADENVRRFIMLRRVRAEVLSRQPIHLLDALYRTTSSLATDPWDRIFALLGLTFDGSHFVPEPSYFGSVSQSFTEFATSLLKSNEPLNFIYLRSANRKVAGDLPSWVPDWTDLDDHVAHRQFDCIMMHSPQRVESSETLKVSDIKVSGLELYVKGVLIDTVNGLGSALSFNGIAFAHEIAIPDEIANPYHSKDEISRIVYRTLVSTELFPGAQCKTLDAMPAGFYHIWSMESTQQLEEMVPNIVPKNLSDSLCTWLAENRSFLVHGQTIEWWTKTWSKVPSENSDSVQNVRQFFDTIRSRMRLLITKGGYLGWAHPQVRKGDRVAILFGCKRAVILRAHHNGYCVVGDACLSGQSTEDLEKMGADKVENVRIL